MSLILLLNPKQYGGTPILEADTSDILDRYRKKRVNEEQLLEEEIAAQILKARHEQIVLPKNLDTKRFAEILRERLDDPQVNAKKRRQIHLILLMIAMDDYE